MKLYYLLAWVLIAIATTVSRADAGADDRYPWLDNLEQARAIAAASHKPLLVVFRCEP
ncbi:MAG: hypothetical protein ACI9R3_001658 [Verrucomicrobiales bacterium]|jgi:hypothetical protein